MSSTLTLHDLPAVERPRERLVTHGVAHLSSVEVLALILGRGAHGEPVVKIAEQLLSVFGSLTGIAQASIQDLQAVGGIGLAKSCQLQACAEMARRMKQDQSEVSPASKISSPEEIFSLITKYITDPYKEHYLLVSLDVRSRLLGVDVVSIGILDAALVHPRETFAAAMKRHAAKVIVCHNHPSGEVQPSDDDLVVTKRLVTAGKILGITVVDHVIVSRDGFYSMQAEERM